MMARLVWGLVVASVGYVLPLIGAPERHDPRVWFAIAGAFALVAAQPGLRRQDVRADAPTDRGTAPLIMFVAVATQVLASLELRWTHSPATALSWVLGAGAIVAGSALRVTAIATLGRWFTGTVRVVEDQAVVTAGPYRWVRHPSYLGALVAILGAPILFGAWWALGLSAAAMLAVYHRRIALEEEALVRTLGDAYVRYRARTWALLPGVW